MEQEIWKDIAWYNWLYQVSNLGRIFSQKRRNTKGGILRPWSNPQGYEIASIYKDGKQCYHTVHRLVALAFIPQIEWKDQVNHKNGDKKDNRVENLEWCTQSENLCHRHRVLWVPPNKTGLWKFGVLHPNSKPVEQYSLQWEFIKEYAGISEAKRETWIVSIQEACSWRYKQAWWFIWKYKKQPE